MDTATKVSIAIAVATAIWAVMGWFITSLLSRLSKLEDAFVAHQLACAKDYVTMPALLQVMKSLDSTLSSLSELIKENARETREGMNALNGRIDNILNEKHGK